MALITPGGGVGSAAIGATLTLSGNAALNSGDTVTFDTAREDPRGFFNAAGHNLKVPAGLAGLYLYGFAVQVQGTAGLSFAQVTGVVVGNADNVFAQGPAQATTNWAQTALGQQRFAVGDTLTVTLGYVGTNGSQLFMLRVST